MDDTDDKAGFSLPVSSFNRTVLPGLRRYKGGAGHGGRRLSFQYHPLVLYTAAVLTVELLSLAISKAAKNPRWYLGHETLFVYIAAGIIVVNWIGKNVLLVFFGIDLLPAWG